MALKFLCYLLLYAKSGEFQIQQKKKTLSKKEFPTLKKKSLILKIINISFDDYKWKIFAKLLGFGEKALTLFVNTERVSLKRDKYSTQSIIIL